MKTKYCFKCGKEINEDAEFCPHCGAKQEHTTNEGINNDTQQSQSNDMNDIMGSSSSNDQQTISKSSNPASMGKAFTLFWQNYFNFSGRSSRSEFWFWYLWQLIIGLIFTLLIAIVGGQQASPVMDDMLGFVVIVGLIYSIGSVIPTLSLDARRIRDAGFPNIAIVLLIVGLFIPFIDIIPAIFMLVVFFLPSK